jgi:hypothetical protein
LLFSSKQDAQEALQATARHLQKLQERNAPIADSSKEDPFSKERESFYREYLKQSANSLKRQLQERGLQQNGRKPSLAARLAEYDLQREYGMISTLDDEEEEVTKWRNVVEENDSVTPITTFCGITLSEAAANALGSAEFTTPSGIQAQAIPPLMQGEAAILHAETGSGKTLAYLLPFTERLWKNNGEGFGVVMTPTRELAAQVAGIATVLAPPGTVRLISQATNLMSDGIKERGEGEFGGRVHDDASRNSPRLFIGSAKSIMQSLYGDGIMPASPTTKPEAQYFLKNVRYLVLDEVDRLLQVKKSRSESTTKSKKHEKPAAIVTAAVTRMTLGRAQIVAASATVGRPLKRELARVLGLPAHSCPRVIRGDEPSGSSSSNASSRAVTVPLTVNNYVVAVDGSSTGKLLTSAFFVIKQLANKPRKMLLVLTRACNMSTKNAVGALKHFQCKPEPVSLLDALEASGTNDMISVHRQVSGASGVGESNSYFSKQETDDEEEKSDDGYLLVTGEDTVRGLHLDGLDVVIVVGRPHGPDEYTHIAGRTGRAGLTGSVINVVSDENAAALKSWEQMLSLSFKKLDADHIANL